MYLWHSQGGGRQCYALSFKGIRGCLAVPAALAHHKQWCASNLWLTNEQSVQGVCSDAGSFDLTGANLGAAIQEVVAAVEVALVRRDSEGQTDAQVTFLYMTHNLSEPQAHHLALEDVHLCARMTCCPDHDVGLPAT